MTLSKSDNTNDWPSLDRVRELTFGYSAELDKRGYSVETILECLDEYKPRKIDYERAVDDLARQLQFYSAIKNHVHSVRFRVKDPEHLIDKLVRKCLAPKGRRISAKTLFDPVKGVVDLGGLRILHLYKEDWPIIHQYIMSGWDRRVRVIKKTAYLRRDENKQPYRRYFRGKNEIQYREDTNYTSLHYDLKYTVTKYIDLFVECQVRTVFDEGWGEINHRHCYPHDTTSIIKAQLSILNKTSSMANDIASALWDLDRLPLFVPWERELELERSSESIYCLTKDLEWAANNTTKLVTVLKRSPASLNYNYVIPTNQRLAAKQKLNANKRQLLKQLGDLKDRVKFRFCNAKVPLMLFSDVLLLKNALDPTTKSRKYIGVIAAPARGDMIREQDKLDIVITDRDTVHGLVDLFNTVDNKLRLSI